MADLNLLRDPRKQFLECAANPDRVNVTTLLGGDANAPSPLFQQPANPITSGLGPSIFDYNPVSVLLDKYNEWKEKRRKATR